MISFSSGVGSYFFEASDGQSYSWRLAASGSIEPGWSVSFSVVALGIHKTYD